MHVYSSLPTEGTIRPAEACISMYVYQKANKDKFTTADRDDNANSCSSSRRISRKICLGPFLTVGQATDRTKYLSFWFTTMQRPSRRSKRHQSSMMSVHIYLIEKFTYRDLQPGESIKILALF